MCCAVLSHFSHVSLQPRGLYSPPGSSVHGILQARILEGCHALFQEIVPTWGSNLGLPHCRQILYCLSQILYHCCSQTPQEANSLRRTTQIVKCSLLHRRVQSRVSSWLGILTEFCDNLLYLKYTCPSPHPQISQVCS